MQQSLFAEYEKIQSNSCNFKNLTIKPCIDDSFRWQFTVTPTQGTYTNYCIDGIIKFNNNYRQTPKVYLLVNIPHSSVLSWNEKNILSLDSLSDKNNYSIFKMVKELSTMFNVEISTETDEIDERVSKTLKSLKKIKPIKELSDFPNTIQHECIKNNITELNEFQTKIINDLCQGNDGVFVSRGGSGKSMAVILSLLYRLFKHTNTFNKPLHAFIIVSDRIKVQILAEMVETLEDICIPNFKVYRLCLREWGYVSKYEINKKSRNLFICTLDGVYDLFMKCKNEIINNLLTINIMDFDSFSPKNGMDKLQNMFKSVSHDININIFSNSWYKYLDVSVKKLFGYRHKHFIFNKYENVAQHYYIDCEYITKREELIKYCKYIKKGIIFVANPDICWVLQSKLHWNNMSSAVFTNDLYVTANKLINEFNAGDINYLIITKDSPIHMLWKCKDLNIIINYDLLCFQWYFKRVSISNNKIKVVSFIDESEQKLYASLTPKHFELFVIQTSEYELYDDGYVDAQEIKQENVDIIDITDVKYNELEHKLDEKNEAIQALQAQINHMNAQNREQKIIIATLKTESETKTKMDEERKTNLKLLASNMNDALVEFGNRYDDDELGTNNQDILKQKMEELRQDINSIATLKKCVALMDSGSKATKDYIESLLMPWPDVQKYTNWDVNEMIIWISSIEEGRFNKYSDILRKGFNSDEIMSGTQLTDLNKSDLRGQPFLIKSFDDRRDLINAFQSLRDYEKEGS